MYSSIAVGRTHLSYALTIFHKRVLSSFEYDAYERTYFLSTTGSGDKAKSKTEYYVFLQDSGKHGLTSEQPTSGLKRSNVSTEIKTAQEKLNEKKKPEGGSTANYFFCKVN